MHEDVWKGAAEYQSGHCHFGSRATALNSSEQPITTVSEVNSSYMHTAEDPEEEPEEVMLLHELPLKT